MRIEIARGSRRLLRSLVVEDCNGAITAIPDDALEFDITGLRPFNLRGKVIVPIRFGSVEKDVRCEVSSDEICQRLAVKTHPARIVLSAHSF